MPKFSIEDFFNGQQGCTTASASASRLLAAERGLVAAEISTIVRLSEESVRRWLKRYMAEGIEGLKDDPRPGRPGEVTAEYVTRLLEVVRRRPRSLDLPFSLWKSRSSHDAQ